MRSAFALAAFLLLAGCETSPIGGRCSENADCDRSMSGATAQCYSVTSPGRPCTGGSNNCVCCPVDTAAANLIDGCHRTPDTDSGVEAGTDAATDASADSGNDAADVGTDAMNDVGTDTGVGCTCTIGQYCDTSSGTPTCVPQRAIGVTCAVDTECQTSHCADSVCCNSACSGAGLSCNSSPDFAGLCMPIASMDAGATDGATE